MRIGSIVLCLVVLTSGPRVALAEGAAEREDVAAARALFEANLDAIRHKDRAAYLATYLEAETLARTGPGGLQLGFEAHATQTADPSWPDLFEALDLQLVPVRPGVVYGTYRYRVRYGEREDAGLSERVFVKTDAGWRIAVTSAFSAPPGTPPPPRALVGATLIDGTGGAPIPDAAVVLRGGRIECAGPRDRCPVPDDVETLDLKGLWITPGLIDAHVHFSQTGWADGRPDALDLREKYPYEQVQAGLRANPQRWYRSYLCSGVTAVFDVGGYPWTWSLRGPSETDTEAPHVESAGPLLSTIDFWLNLPAERQFIHLADEETGRAGVRYLAEHRSSAVKVWFIVTPDSDFEALSAAVLAAGQEARRLDLPLIVHATGLREAKVAIRAGAHLLVHSVWDKEVDDEFIQLAKGQGTIYCPTLIVGDGYRRMFESVVSGEPPAIDDPGSCLDPEIRARVAETPILGAGKVDPESVKGSAERAETRRTIMASNLRRLHEAGIPLAMGTDAGNPLTLHGPSVYAEMEAMETAGMTPMNVLSASTLGGARAMRRQDDLGTVAPGKIADLLVVGADPTRAISNLRKIRYVIRGGEVRSVDELRFDLPR